MFLFSETLANSLLIFMFWQGWEYKGICCWGQCLYVTSRGQGRSWNGDHWGDALNRLTNLAGDGETGLCGALINGDEYLLLLTVRHDAVAIQGKDAGEYFGDTCNGNPPW